MSKRYGLRRRLKRLAKASGITVPNDWGIEQIADAIAENWNADVNMAIHACAARSTWIRARTARS